MQVVRCCLEHASSVAKTFLMSDCVAVEIKEPEPVAAANPMDNSGLWSSTSYIIYTCMLHFITRFIDIFWVLCATGYGY